MASEDCGGRINPKANVDRLSNLPDEVISQILSLLPTDSAVGTSVLSNRWKYLWTSITSLYIEKYGAEDKDFTNFVDKVFRSCNSSSIQKLTVHVGFNSRVEAWIDEAIKRKVREVDIDVLKLPSSLFKCTTLTVLKLVAHFVCDSDNYSFDLPCLRVLYIHGGCQPKHLMEKLISSCPILEDLTIDGYLGYDRLFMVDAPTLKSLRLQLWRDREISVNAPNLERLYLSEYFVKYKIKGDFSSLVKATMIIGDVCLDSRYEPLHVGKSGLPSGFTIPNFDNLKCLEVVTFHHLFWTMLPKLIRISPSLEVLSIKQRGDGDNMPPDEFTWVGPKLAPKCMRFHLSTIKLEGFKGRKHELKMLTYVLGKAKVLQRLIINCQGLKCAEAMEFSQQLLKISKASTSCRIEFHGDLISDYMVQVLGF